MKKYTERIDRISRAVSARVEFVNADERVKHFYNYEIMTTAALIATLRHYAGEIELPDWARTELEQPIPHDARKEDILEAIEASREYAESPDLAGAEDFRDVADRYLKDSGFGSLQEAQEHYELLLPGRQKPAPQN